MKFRMWKKFIQEKFSNPYVLWKFHMWNKFSYVIFPFLIWNTCFVHWSLEKIGSSVLVFERAWEWSQQNLTCAITKRPKSLLIFLLSTFKSISWSSLWQNGQLRRSKDSFINRNSIRTIQKSHSWSLSNGHRNPLPASFSEHGMLDPVFSRDQRFRSKIFHTWKF